MKPCHHFVESAFRCVEPRFPSLLLEFPHVEPTFPCVLLNFPRVESRFPGVELVFPSVLLKIPHVQRQFLGVEFRFPRVEQCSEGVKAELWGTEAWREALPFCVRVSALTLRYMRSSERQATSLLDAAQIHPGSDRRNPAKNY